MLLRKLAAKALGQQEEPAALRTKLLPHQERVLEKMRDRPGLVVAHGLGSGKTLSSIAAAMNLAPDDAQVLVPASLISNYEKELVKHVEGRPNISVGSLQNAVAKGALPEGGFLVVDEAHRARNPNSKTYQLLRDSKAAKRMLLTASPTYNRPSDVAALVNLAAGDRVIPQGSEFDKRFISQPSKGIWGLLPFTQKEPKLRSNPRLRKTLRQWVDYHNVQGKDFPSVSEENVDVPMTKRQTQLHDAAWGQLPLLSRLRLRRGLPPGKEDLPALNRFQSQTRQIASTENPFTKGDAEITPKIRKAVEAFSSAAAEDPKHKAVIYSNFLGTLNDYSKQLSESGVPHAIFSGSQPMKERKQIVQDYNAGKLKALLVSSAGGEGLDLKGTRQVQIMEPHWNEEKIKQVAGRAIRRGSHTHLPEEERTVKVQRFAAYPRGGFFRRRKGVEQVLQSMSVNKENLNKQMREMLQQKEAAAHVLQGHIEVQGLPIAIENRAGSVRKGTTEDGHHWRTKMRCPYGYIKGTEGKDGEEIDVFVGPNKEAPKAFVVHQHKPDGKGFDEDKVILGVESKKDAEKLYLQHYDDPKFLGPISTMPVEDLKRKVETGKTIRKLAEAVLSRSERSSDASGTHRKLAGALVPRGAPGRSEGLSGAPQLKKCAGGVKSSRIGFLQTRPGRLVGEGM